LGLTRTFFHKDAFVLVRITYVLCFLYKVKTYYTKNKRLYAHSFHNNTTSRINDGNPKWPRQPHPCCWSCYYDVISKRLYYYNCWQSLPRCDNNSCCRCVKFVLHVTWAMLHYEWLCKRNTCQNSKNHLFVTEPKKIE